MLKRKLVLITLIALLTSTHSYAKTFKVATLTPDGSFWLTAMKDAADVISKKTEDRVKFRFYPGGVMGNDKAVLKKMKIGQLQGAAFSGGALSSRAPDTQIYNIPLLFNSYEEIDYVRKQLDAEVEKGFEKEGYISFGLAEGGFAYIMSKKPVIDSSSLSDMKVWVPADDPASQSAAETFSFAPITLSIGDVLTGLQTDLINTVTTSPVAAIALQWHTQIKYVTEIPLAYFYALMVLDQKAFNQISPEDQKIVQEEMRKAFAKLDKQNRIDNDKALAALKDQGIEILTPSPEQMTEWKSLTGKAAETYVSKAGINPALVEKTRKILTEYRSQKK